MANSFSPTMTTLLQGGLYATALTATGCSMDATSATALTVTAVTALGAGAWAAHRRLSRMREAGVVQPLLLTQQEISDETIRENLSAELAERYPVLGEPKFDGLRGILVREIFQEFVAAGSPIDDAYPDLRGCIPESMLERVIAGFGEKRLAGAQGELRRLRDGLESGGLGQRSARWAPRNVEGSALEFLKSSYPVFGNDDYASLATALAKKSFQTWVQQGSPALMDKPGPATPLIETCVHDHVRNLMTGLAGHLGNIKLARLLRELRRNERRRSMESSTLHRRLQDAACEAEILGLYASQMRFPNETLKNQFLKTVKTLRQAPEAGVSKEDLDRYAGLEGRAGDEAYARELVGLCHDLKSRADQARTKEEAAIRERLKWLQAVVANPEAVGGLDVGALGPVHPVVPHWARSVTVRVRGNEGDVRESRLTLSAEGTVTDPALGIEMVYRDGGYWLRDARGLARLHPANWLRPFQVNEERVSAGAFWPVRSGDRLKAGPAVEVEFVLPDVPPLERMRLRIARVTTLEELAKLLKDNGQKSLAAQVDDFLAEGEGFSNIPSEGGLDVKLAELALRREAARIHERYFLDQAYLDAESRMAALARRVAEANDIGELARVVEVSSLSDGAEIAEAIRASDGARGSRSLAGIPDLFGIRTRADFFLREKERKLGVEVRRLGEEVSRLAGELRDANQTIVNRDKTISDGTSREADLRSELQAAREALKQQEAAAKAEKERLEAQVRSVRAQAKETAQIVDENHRKAIERIEKRHEEVVKAKKDEIKRLIEEHVAQFRALEAEHKAALETLKESHAQEIEARNEAEAELKRSHAETIASQQASHAEAMAAKEAEIDSLNAAHAEVVNNLNAAHEATMAVQQAGHEQATATLQEQHRAAMAELEKHRAAWEAYARTLEAEKAALEGTKAGLEFRKAELESELDETRRLLAAAEETRDNYYGQLSTARAQLGVRNSELGESTAKVRQQEVRIAELEDGLRTAQNQVAVLKESLRDSDKELDRLRKEELPRLDAKIRERDEDLRQYRLLDADLDLYISALEQQLELTAATASTGDYIERLKRILKAAEGRLAAVPVPTEEMIPELPAEETAAEGVPDEGIVAGIEYVPVEDDIAIEDAGFPEEAVTRRQIQMPPHPVPAEDVSESERERLRSPFFGGGDPRVHRIERFDLSGKRELWNMDGKKVGLAWICAGNHVDRWQERVRKGVGEPAEKFQMSFADGSLLSGKTSAGSRNYQEDGVYMASYELPDGRTVKIIAGADGAGGMGGGDVISSSFLQSIHAAVNEAAAMGRADLTAGELFEQGEIGARRQKEEHGAPKGATASAGVIVILGDRATVATKGDAMVVQGRFQDDGSYRTVGYSQIQHIESLGNDQLLGVFRQTMKNPNLPHKSARCITGGVSMNGKVCLYAASVRSGDQFLIQSDGGYGNNLGDHYKINGSNEMRQLAASARLEVPKMTQAQLAPLNRMMEITSGREDAAHGIHDVAVYNQTLRRSGHGHDDRFTAEFFGKEFELPAKRDSDNVFALSYQQGGKLETGEPAAPGYGMLEVPGTDYFGGADPRRSAVEPRVKGYLPLRGPAGYGVGGAVMTGGGEEGHNHFTHFDRSLLSAVTSAGFSAEKGKLKHQQDGYYMATYTLPDGTPVKVLVVSDGAGGMGMSGHVASSAFLQGVHARVAEVAEAGLPVVAGDLFAEGQAALLKQRALIGDRQATATASIVVVVGNTATGATLGDATVLRARRQANGTYRTSQYSAADYYETPAGKSTGLIDGKNKPHLYFIDDLENGDFFFLASDAQTNIHGTGYKMQASAEGRKIGGLVNESHITPLNDNNFQAMNRLLQVVSGREDAASLIHDFVVQAMSRPRTNPSTSPIPVLEMPVTPPAEPDSDNVVVLTLQHAASAFPGLERPDGYGPMEDVVVVSQDPISHVRFSIATNRAPAHHEKYLVLGRFHPECDEVIPHGSVSRVHGHLVHNAGGGGNFKAQTWYFRPVSDNPEGTYVDGKPVRKDTWVALENGTRLKMGGVPLRVTVDADRTISFESDFSDRRPQPIPPLPPVPGGRVPPPPPPPPPPQPSRPSGPPQLEGNVVFINGAQLIHFVTAIGRAGTVSPTPQTAQGKSFDVTLGLGMGRTALVSVLRNGDGLKVQNNHSAAKVTLRLPSDPSKEISLGKGEALDVPINTVLHINGKHAYVLRSQK